MLKWRKESEMTEQEATNVLVDMLQQCGVPKLAIDTESNLRMVDATVLRLDLVIVAADGETPLAAFEVKSHGDLAKNYRMAKLELGLLLKKGIKAFVVAPDAKGELRFAQVGKCWPWKKWYPLSDLRKVLGSYVHESMRVQERLNINDARLARFRHWVVFVGVLTAADVAIIEELGFEFSGKVYALVGLVFLLYTVSYGFDLKVSFKGTEISLCPKEERHAENEQKN